jgi:hypothetical protein
MLNSVILVGPRPRMHTEGCLTNLSACPDQEHRPARRVTDNVKGYHDAPNALKQAT